MLPAHVCHLCSACQCALLLLDDRPEAVVLTACVPGPSRDMTAGDGEALTMPAPRKGSAKQDVRLQSYRRRMNAQALRAARARIVRRRGEVVARSTRRPVAGVQVRKARASRQHGQERDESGGEEASWDEDDEEKEGDDDGSVAASGKGRRHAGRRRQREQTPQDGADR